MIKQFCKYGHRFTSDNTYTRPSNGKRACRICLRKKSKFWRETHPEETKKYLHEWYKKNKEHVKAESKKWGKSNLEQERVRKRMWARENPEAGRRAARKRRALKKSGLGLWHQFEEQLVVLMRRSQKGLCYYCKTPISSELPPQNAQREILEHPQPLSRGGTHGIDNWVLSCFACNARKGDKTLIEFLEILNE